VAILADGLIGSPAVALLGCPAMALEITPVRGGADVRQFVDLPYRLHAGTPWIPPLKLERYV